MAYGHWDSVLRTPLQRRALSRQSMLLRLLVLAFVNIVNIVVFWVMWRGFYTNAELIVFNWMLAFCGLTTLLSFSLFFLHGSRILMWLSQFGNAPEGGGRQSFANLSVLVGAYAMGAVNIITACVILAISGTIDIWASGNA